MVSTPPFNSLCNYLLMEVFRATSPTQSTPESLFSQAFVFFFPFLVLLFISSFIRFVFFSSFSYFFPSFYQFPSGFCFSVLFSFLFWSFVVSPLRHSIAITRNPSPFLLSSLFSSYFPFFSLRTLALFYSLFPAFETLVFFMFVPLFLSPFLCSFSLSSVPVPPRTAPSPRRHD